MRLSNDGKPCAKLGMHYAFLAMRRPFRVMLYPFLAMLHAFPAMLHEFAATRSEGEDAICEESRGHHALQGVLFPVLTTPRSRVSTTLRQSRRRAVGRGRAVPFHWIGSECVGSSSERATMHSAYVGMPRELLEGPNDDNTMRTMQCSTDEPRRLMDGS
jgi:hypothetical protein